MRGYDDDMDEYEEDGYYEEDEELGEYEEEEEVEEEERKPTKEELDYLGIRQRLKEKMRKQMKKENGSSLGNSQEKKKLPYDNYGSFFGPSQPVIAQRVIQESKSLLENPHLATRILSSHQNSQSKKNPVAQAAVPRPGGHIRPPKIVNPVQQKVQKLKDMRDYSFLFSEDAELPAPKKEHPPRNGSITNSDTRPAQVLSRGPKSATSTSRTLPTGHEERKHVSVGRQVQSKPLQHKVAPGSSRPNPTLANPKKQLGSSTNSVPGRNVGVKGVPSKMPVPNRSSTLNRAPISNRVIAPNMDKKVTVAGARKPMPHVQKAPLHKSNSSTAGVQRAPLSKTHAPEQRRDIRDPDRAKQMSKPSVSSSRPQMNPPKRIPPRPPVPMDRPKKRPARQYSDDEDDQAINMIRNMFKYNPKKYVGVDEDDSDMEANFDDILREERRSEKIAKEEDERELKLIEEEERRERMRKEAKRRKLSQR